MFRRKRKLENFSAEIEAHLQLEIERLQEQGLSEEDARAAARRAFGNITQAKEYFYESGHWLWWDHLLQDVRYGLRMLARNPGFTAVAVITLGLGLGLNTAFFTVFNACLLRPFTVRDPYSLFRIAFQEKGRLDFRFSQQQFDRLRTETAVFQEALAEHQVFTNMEGKASRGLILSGNYFSMLGGDTSRGRPIHDDDVAPILVLSYQAWKTRFGSDADIVGKAVHLGRQLFVVIGVARPAFQGLEPTPPDFWLPVAAWSQAVTSPDVSDLEVVGRLREGVTKERAHAALSAYAHEATADQPQERRAFGMELRSAATMTALPQEAILAFLPLLVAFGLTMAIPCANVANMMLARALARQREIGVRLSLGASRNRLVRQLLTEGLLLASLASLIGLGTARGTLDLAVRVLFATIPSPAVPFLHSIVPDLNVDYRVFLFVLTVTVITTVAFALAPALQATQLKLSLALRGEFGTQRASRLRNGLVVAQVAICLLLLICAGVLLRGTARMASIDLGYEARSVYSFSLLASATPTTLTQTAESLQRESWVESLAYASEAREMQVEPSGANQMYPATYSFVTPEYFRTFRIPVIRGRSFVKQEAVSGAAVVLVSQATANRFWPGKEPTGQTLRIDMTQGPNKGNDSLPRFAQAEVIGVTKDVISGQVWGGVDQTHLYFPATYEGSRATGMFVRGKGTSEKTRQLLEQALAQMMPDTPASVYSLEQRRYWDIYPVQAASWMSSLLGAVALLLTISGIYGVMSYIVKQRTKEIGIRMALGASSTGVVRFVMGHSARLAGGGMVLGVGLAIGASKLFASLMASQINTFDAVAYSGGMVFVALAAAAAALGPAWRATRVDPMVTLRYE